MPRSTCPPSRRRRPRFPLLVLLALLPALPAAAQDASSPVAASPAVEVDRVALITPASRTNQGWDQQAADALDAVAAELGIEAEIADSAGYDDITPILRDLAAEGANLIICHASGYQTVCPEFAAASGVPVSVVENPAAVAPGLVADVETEAQQAAYLAGVLAGEVSRSGTVAVAVSGEPPTWNLMTVGFAEGLAATRPEAELLYNVIGEAAYDDAAAAKRVVEQQLAAGADVVFGQGDGASFGMIQAIAEHNAALGDDEPPAWFIDVIGDKRADHADLLLSSVLFDYTGLYRRMVADLEAGTFGGVYTLTMENGGVRLLEPPAGIPEAARQAVDEARRAILDGTITVSTVPDAEGARARLDELFPN